MAFKPLHDRVAGQTRRKRREDQGRSDHPRQRERKAGRGRRSSPLAKAPKDVDGELIAPYVKKGDKILFGKWSGTEITLDGEELLIMKESDILGIIA